MKVTTRKQAEAMLIENPNNAENITFKCEQSRIEYYGGFFWCVNKKRGSFNTKNLKEALDYMYK